MDRLQVYRVLVTDGVIQIFCILTGLCVCVCVCVCVCILSITEKGGLKSHILTVDLSVLPFSSVNFMYLKLC